MTKYYKDFSVTGSANTVVYDTGLESTETEHRKLVEILIKTSSYQGNTIRVIREREDIARVPERLVDTVFADVAGNPLYSTTKLDRIELNQDIPVGQRMQVGIECGANATDIEGCYVYEIL